MQRAFFFLCTFLLYANAKLIFLNSSVNNTFEAPSFQFLDAPKNFEFINETLVLADPKDACKKLKNDVNGKIVLVLVEVGCKVIESAQNVEDAGGIAFIYARKDGFPGDFAGTYFYGSHKVKIPGAEVVLNSDYNKITDITSDKTKTVLVTLSNDPYDNANFYIGFSVVIGLLSIVNIALATQQLRRFVLRYGFKSSLAQVCLWIELFCNAERIIMCVEPTAGIRRGCYDFYLLQAFTTLSVPFTFITCGLIALYWNRILRTFSKRVQKDVQVFSLEKWKIPFVIIAIIILLLELLADLLRGAVVPAGGEVQTLNGVIYIILALIGAVWFAYNGIRMLLFLKNSSSLLAGSRTAGIARLTKLVCAISFGMLLVMIGAALTTVVSSPVFRAGLFLSFIGLSLVSLSQILMFRVEGVTESQTTPGLDSSHVEMASATKSSSHNSITA